MIGTTENKRELPKIETLDQAMGVVFQKMSDPYHAPFVRKALEEGLAVEYTVVIKTEEDGIKVSLVRKDRFPTQNIIFMKGLC